MTGPEHYTKAQSLLEDAQHAVNPEKVLARAQVHATLALAAATAAPEERSRGWVASVGWHEAITA